jgi:hypothetical protein
MTTGKLFLFRKSRCLIPTNLLFAPNFLYMRVYPRQSEPEMRFHTFFFFLAPFSPCDLGPVCSNHRL